MSKRGRKFRELVNGGNPTPGLTAVATSFSGPLPPPQILEGYERIQSGAADRIIKMAEAQAGHRQGLEKDIIKSNINNERTGMWLAFVLTLILLVGGGYLIEKGKDVAGYLAVFIPVIFHAGNYIYNKSREVKAHKKEEN